MRFSAIHTFTVSAIPMCFSTIHTFLTLREKTQLMQWRTDSSLANNFCLETLGCAWQTSYFSQRLLERSREGSETEGGSESGEEGFWRRSRRVLQKVYAAGSLESKFW